MDRRDAMKFSGLAALGLMGAPAVAAATSDAAATPLGPIIDYLNGADATAARLGITDPAFKPTYYQFLMQLLAIGQIQVFGNSLERPAWVPYMPVYLPWGAPNGDDIYRCCPVDARGTYRLSGVKGTSLFSFVTMKKAGAHLGQISSGKTLGEFDLNLLETDKKGRYSILLSATRPEGYTGLWKALDPDTTQFMYRSRTKTIGQVDTSCAIERLDGHAAPSFPTADAVSAKMAALASYAHKQVDFLIGYQSNIRARGGDKGFILDSQVAYGALLAQRYLLHVFTLAPDEALILESEVPDKVEYWSVQLFDTQFSAFDTRTHQTFLNDARAHVDKDRRVRFVVSSQDPGVANWLDAGGWPQGGLQWRWNNASSCPIPSVRKVKVANVAAALPADTPKLSTEQRAEAWHAYSLYYQSRGV